MDILLIKACPAKQLRTSSFCMPTLVLISHDLVGKESLALTLGGVSKGGGCSVHPGVCLFVHPGVCLFVHPGVCLLVTLRLFVRVSFC